MSIIIGIVVGLGAILAGFMIEGGNLASLLSVSPILIVLGGTIGATIASYSFNDIIKAFKALLGSFSKKSKGNPLEIIEQLKTISDKCRKEGLLSIEKFLSDESMQGKDKLFMKEGLILLIDGKNEEEIQYALESDIRAYTLQKQLEIAVFESAGGFSPTMGVLGTVMSLVNVLGNMSGDSTALCESIATAFIATMYGVGIANIIWLPIATKLKADLKRQKIQKEMILDGICMIARGEAARNIENKLSLYWQAFPGGDAKYKEGIEN